MPHLAWMMLFGMVSSTVVLEVHRRGPRYIVALRIWMKREIARYPELSEERIDRALLAAESTVYRGKRRVLLMAPSLACLALGMFLAAWMFPMRVWNGDDLLALPALFAVVLAPGMIVGWFMNRRVTREMIHELRRRLPESVT